MNTENEPIYCKDLAEIFVWFDQNNLHTTLIEDFFLKNCATFNGFN